MTDRELLIAAAKAAGEPKGFDRTFNSSNYSAPGESAEGWGMVSGFIS